MCQLQYRAVEGTEYLHPLRHCEHGFYRFYSHSRRVCLSTLILCLC
jgi:hypothetical protein